jgi:hypothetical protein
VNSHEKNNDALLFYWDRNAGTTPEANQIGQDQKHDLQDYLEWLEEFKMDREELRQIKIFPKPFTLLSRQPLNYSGKEPTAPKRILQ